LDKITIKALNLGSFS